MARSREGWRNMVHLMLSYQRPAMGSNSHHAFHFFIHKIRFPQTEPEKNSKVARSTVDKKASRVVESLLRKSPLLRCYYDFVQRNPEYPVGIRPNALTPHGFDLFSGNSAAVPALLLICLLPSAVVRPNTSKLRIFAALEHFTEE